MDIEKMLDAVVKDFESLVTLVPMPPETETKGGVAFTRAVAVALYFKALTSSASPEIIDTIDAVAQGLLLAGRVNAPPKDMLN